MGPLKRITKTYGAAPKAEAKARRRQKRLALKTIQLKATHLKVNLDVESQSFLRRSKSSRSSKETSLQNTTKQIPFWETNKTKWNFSDSLSSIDCETTFDKLMSTKNTEKEKEVSVSKKKMLDWSNYHEHEQTTSIHHVLNEAKQTSDFCSFVLDQNKVTSSSHPDNVTNKLSALVIESDTFTNLTSTPCHLRKADLVIDASKLSLTPKCSPIVKNSRRMCISSIHKSRETSVLKQIQTLNNSDHSLKSMYRSPDPFQSICISPSIDNLELDYNTYHTVNVNSNDVRLVTDDSKDALYQIPKPVECVTSFQSIGNFTTSCANDNFKENYATSIIEDIYDNIKLKTRGREHKSDSFRSIRNGPSKEECDSSVVTRASYRRFSKKVLDNSASSRARYSRRSLLKSHNSMINQRYSHQVVPAKIVAEPKPESIYFRDFHGIINEAIPDESNELGEYEKHEVSAATTNVSSSGFSPTGRDVVLQKCNQDGPIPFIEAYPETYLEKCRKIGEGLYGEVFKHVDGTKSSVIKVIPVDGEELVNGERQKKFHEILSEIVIAKELSDLRCSGNDVQTSGFVEVIQNYCLQGQYPQKLIDLWNEFEEECGTDNDSPTMFKESQLYIVLELADGGTEMEKFVFTNSNEALSVLLQTAYALAAAEQSKEFEHRDLHWGNVLISTTSIKKEKYLINGKENSVPTQGVQVAIIDFTLSRMTYEGCCIFNDLSVDNDLFTSTGDYQFDMYRMMKENCNNDWSQFCPYNNVIWLHYIVDKMIDTNGVHYKNTKTKVHENGISKLIQIKNKLLSYSSTVDFVSSL